MKYRVRKLQNKFGIVPKIIMILGDKGFVEVIGNETTDDGNISNFTLNTCLV